MARVLVLKHVAAEPLGLLDPMLRARGHRIRYINFSRHPDASPNLDRYRALIVLGGSMQIDQTDRHPHLRTECRLIEQALAEDKPVLGICLGAQLLAHVCGAHVGPVARPEIGWYPVHPTAATADDPVLSPLTEPQQIYQWHHWGFDCPDGAVRLAEHPESGCQAFRVDHCGWGFQFHLELDQRLIHRWLTLKPYRHDLEQSGLDRTPDEIRRETEHHLPRALTLAEQVFGRWLDQLGTPERRLVLGSR
ncbi:MAG: gamma-glutamyl-gamma-aminobutyrate hydrolase family protein [Wenzhouxiangellaceae bacterium]|nr:gamma-glutamyl-gamma-aminobutyrate hydrolase family protein [Wenzhouxiangellaceae bacterium]